MIPFNDLNGKHHVIDENEAQSFRLEKTFFGIALTGDLCYASPKFFVGGFPVCRTIFRRLYMLCPKRNVEYVCK